MTNGRRRDSSGVETTCLSCIATFMANDQQCPVEAAFAGPKKIAEHGSITTTQRYLHPDRQSVTNAGELLFKHLSGQVN